MRMKFRMSSNCTTGRTMALLRCKSTLLLVKIGVLIWSVGFDSATFALQLGEEMIDLMIDHVKENKCVNIYVRS